jgi:hypothetical protein
MLPKKNALLQVFSLSYFENITKNSVIVNQAWNGKYNGKPKAAIPHEIYSNSPKKLKFIL